MNQNQSIRTPLTLASILTAVTNNSGNFTFPVVKPGFRYLIVDPVSIGLKRIPNLKSPVGLEVTSSSHKGGQERSVIIPVVQAAWLSGQIMVYGYEDDNNKITQGDPNKPYYIAGNTGKNGKLCANYGLAGTVVELRKGSEIKRAVTNSEGNFELAGLRPGKSIIKIYSNNLPEYHYLEKDTFTIDLKPGQGTEISTRVLPKKRRIKIISEPRTLIEQK